MELREIIKKEIDQTVSEKNIVKLIREIDETIRFCKMADYRILKLTPSENKETYLESRQNSIINYFKHNELIVESYNNYFGRTLLQESTRNYKREIFEFYEFLKYSVLLESGLINEQTYNPFNKDFWSMKNAKQVGGQALNVAKTAVEYSPLGLAYKGGKYLYEKASQAVDYIKKNGVSVIFEKIRELLFNGYYNAIEIILGFALPGWGQVLTLIPWIVMTFWDGYQYFLNNVSSSSINLVIDVVMMVLGITGAKAAFKASGLKDIAKQGIQAVAKEAGKPNFWGKILAFIIEKVPAIKPIVNALKGAVGWFSNMVSKYVIPFFKTIGMDWIAKALSPITKTLQGMSEYVVSEVTKTGQKLISKGVLAVGIKMSKNQFLSKLFGGSLVKSLTNRAFHNWLRNAGSQHLVNYTTQIGFKKVEKFIQSQAEFALEDLFQMVDSQFPGNTYVHDLVGLLLEYQKLVKSAKDYKDYASGKKGKVLAAYKADPSKLGKQIQTFSQDVNNPSHMYRGRGGSLVPGSGSSAEAEEFYKTTKDYYRTEIGLGKTYGGS